MSEAYIGEIRLLAFNFAPDGHLPCDGRLLPISQYDALFSLIGTTYGGDGNTTFALPDLRGRVPVHRGAGTGLSNRALGQAGGTVSVTLTSGQMGAHSHGLRASTSAATATGPAGRVLAAIPAGQGGDTFYATDPGSADATSVGSLGGAGGSEPHDNTAPTLTLQYCIVIDGIYPVP